MAKQLSIQKLETFLECFEGFMRNDPSESVSDRDLADALEYDYGFTKKEIKSYLDEALKTGQIYVKLVVKTRVFGRA